MMTALAVYALVGVAVAVASLSAREPGYVPVTLRQAASIGLRWPVIAIWFAIGAYDLWRRNGL